MEFPWQYNFPPFFTIQPNEDTRKKQMDAWCDLVLAYCKHKRLFQLDLADSLTSELFSNKKIDRKCSLELAVTIIDELVRRSRAEWLGIDSSPGRSKSKNSSSNADMNNKRSCIILWNSLEEWAKLIYDYVNRNGMQNSVCTFYELTESDDCRREEFYRLDPIVLRKSLTVLQRQRKAEMFGVDDGGDSEHQGVKFF